MMDEEVIVTNKQLDIIDKAGNVTHYNMNDYMWNSHGKGYYDYAIKLLEQNDIPELKCLIQSDDIMDYYKIEYPLISKVGCISHKSWIDEEEEYHHFCMPKNGITLEQQKQYKILKQKYYDGEEMWYEEDEHNFYGWIFIKEAQKYK